MSIQIQNALGVLSSEAPTGNLVWVDGINGVDKLARRGRMTIPFRTLSEAKAAAQGPVDDQPGDTIIVLPGNYVDANLAKNGVNWHFLTGAKVTHPSGTLFEVSSSMSFKVTGEGVFETIDGIVLTVENSDASVLFKCDSMTADTVPCVFVSAGNLTLHSRTLECEGSDCLYLSGGMLEIDAYRITSHGGSGIFLTSGAAARVRAFEIVSSVAPAITYESSERLIIQNARLVSEGNDADGLAVYAAGGSSGITLHSCVLIPDDSAGESIEAASGPFTVQIHGACTARLRKGDNVVTIPLTQSPNLFGRDGSVT